MIDETETTTEEEDKESTMIEAPETTEMIEMKIVNSNPTTTITMQPLAITMVELMRTNQLSSDSQR